jgi:hypothetical protein
MKNLITRIFKRTKPQEQEKPFVSDWKQEHFEKNVKQGVESLFSGKTVLIYDDGRDYELALAIKQEYILQRQKHLAEKIKIEPWSEGTKVEIRNL